MTQYWYINDSHIKADNVTNEFLTEPNFDISDLIHVPSKDADCLDFKNMKQTYLSILETSCVQRKSTILKHSLYFSLHQIWLRKVFVQLYIFFNRNKQT